MGWQMSPREMDKMTAASFDGLARKWASDLEDREARRSALPVHEARPALARRLGIPAGTLEGLRRDRVKGVRAWVYERLREAVISEIRQEIKRSEHELSIAVQAGLDPRSSEMAALKDAVCRAQEMIGGTK